MVIDGVVPLSDTVAVAVTPLDVPEGAAMVIVGLDVQTESPVGSATFITVPAVQVPHVTVIPDTDQFVTVAVRITVPPVVLGVHDQEATVTAGSLTIYPEPGVSIINTPLAFAVATANPHLFLMVMLVIFFAVVLN